MRWYEESWHHMSMTSTSKDGIFMPAYGYNPLSPDMGITPIDFKGIVKLMADSVDMSQEEREEVLKDVTMQWTSLSYRVGDISMSGRVSYVPVINRKGVIHLPNGRVHEAPFGGFVTFTIRNDRVENWKDTFASNNPHCSLTSKMYLPASLDNLELGNRYRNGRKL